MLNSKKGGLKLKVKLVYHHQYQIRQQAELSIFESIETFYITIGRYKQLNNLTILKHQQLLNNKIKQAA